MSEAMATIGHNNPPATLEETIAGRLKEKLASLEALAKRADKAPRKIDGDADLEKIGTLIKDANVLKRAFESDRVTEKEPFKAAADKVDEIFKAYKTRLERIASTFQAIADDYARKKAAEERAEAARIAKEKADEAERQSELARKAEEAGKGKTATKHEGRAEEAFYQAEAAARAASQSAADVNRQRLNSGVLATATEKWTFEILDFQKIPLDAIRPYLKRDAIEAAIRQHINIHKDSAPLEGVRIFKDVKASFR